MPKTIDDFERQLAREIRSYFSFSDQKEKQNQLRVFASSLSALMERRLKENDNWGAERWIDAIAISASPEIDGSGHILLDGLLIFGDLNKGTQQCWEPFCGSVRISAAGDEVLDYELKFGDVTWGLGAVKYNEHPKGWNWSRPEKWIFEISKP